MPEKTERYIGKSEHRKDYKSSRDYKDSRDTRYQRDNKDNRDYRDSSDTRDYKDSKDNRNYKDSSESWGNNRNNEEKEREKKRKKSDKSSCNEKIIGKQNDRDDDFDEEREKSTPSVLSGSKATADVDIKSTQTTSMDKKDSVTSNSYGFNKGVGKTKNWEYKDITDLPINSGEEEQKEEKTKLKIVDENLVGSKAMKK